MDVARAGKTGRALRGGHSIRVVASQTGLAMGTLRAWERRYGFPSPSRRVGSNRRLYSDRDLEKLIRIAGALDRGYRIGDIVQCTPDEVAALPETGSRAPVGGSTADDVVDELVVHLERNDIGALEGALRQLGAALGCRRFVVEVAHPLAVAVGEGWATGRLAIHQEHVATECLITQLRSMLATLIDVQGSPGVLLASLPGEAHTATLELAALYLAVSGAKPRLMGGSAPGPEIARGAAAHRSDVVGVTVGLSCDPSVVRRELSALRRKLPAGIPVWIGGAGAAGLRLRGEGLRTTTTWVEIDDALAAWRARSTTRRTGRTR